MATHEVDQKLLGRLARRCAVSHPLVSGAMYQILGLSVMLGPRLVDARLMRSDGMDGDTQSLILLHQILWLARTGEDLLKTYIEPAFLKRKKPEPLAEVFAAKLRASFEHIFCLFRNDPSISKILESARTSPKEQAKYDTSPPTRPPGNGRQPSGRSSKGRDYSQGKEQRSSYASPEDGRQRANLREPIPSMLSEASYITNPYSPRPPPGLPPLAPIPTGPHFIVSSKDYRRRANKSFHRAAELAENSLPPPSSLRLSIALEHCAFLWDCMHEHESSRRLARSTVRELQRDSTPIDDDEFQDAATIVTTLGRIMRRKSNETTPRFGAVSPPPPRSTYPPQQSTRNVPQVPPASYRREEGYGVQSQPLANPSPRTGRSSPPLRPYPELSSRRQRAPPPETPYPESSRRQRTPPPERPYPESSKRQRTSPPETPYTEPSRRQRTSPPETPYPESTSRRQRTSPPDQRSPGLFSRAERTSPPRRRSPESSARPRRASPRRASPPRAYLPDSRMPESSSRPQRLSPPNRSPPESSSRSQRTSPRDKPLPSPPREQFAYSTPLSRGSDISRSIQRTPEEYRIPRRPLPASSDESTRSRLRSGGSSTTKPIASSSSSKRDSPERTSNKRPPSPNGSPSRRARVRKNGNGPEKSRR